MESAQIISEKDYKWQLRDGWIPDQDYVFVSYSSRDWEKVYPCVMAMRARGINVYIDIEFMENQSSSWLKNFQERLFRDSGCKGIVTFLSINYMRSYACLVEQMANRTGRMRRHAGRLLPVFYIALEPELRTLQEMYAYIYRDEIRRESTREQVEISPAEYTVLQRFILDSSPGVYQDADSVRELLDDIHDKHDVVINMYDLIFSNAEDMPSIQLYENAEACAQLLTDNFINDKNNSIKMTVLEDLKQESMKRRSQTAPGIQPIGKQYIARSSATVQNVIQPQSAIAGQNTAEPQPPVREQNVIQPQSAVAGQNTAEPQPPVKEQNVIQPQSTVAGQNAAEPQPPVTEQKTAEPQSPVRDQSNIQKDDPEISEVIVRPANPKVEEIETDNPLWSKCKSVFRSCSELLSEQNIIQTPFTEQSTEQEEDPETQDVIVRPANPQIREIETDNQLWAKCKSVFRSRSELLCKQCGAMLRPGGKFCSKCGAKIN